MKIDNIIRDFSTDQVIKITGLSERQLAYWGPSLMLCKTCIATSRSLQSANQMTLEKSNSTATCLTTRE